MNKHSAAAHRHKRALVKEYGRLCEEVTYAFAEYDPIHIGVSPPSQEYDLEVGTVLPRLRTCTSSTDVQVVLHQEFSKWFGEETAGPLTHYEQLGRRIWDLWQQSSVAT